MDNYIYYLILGFLQGGYKKRMINDDENIFSVLDQDLNSIETEPLYIGLDLEQELYG